MLDCESAKTAVATFSRKRKVERFYKYFGRGMTVLDVGVSSPSTSYLSTANYFLNHFRYEPKYYTGLGVQDTTELRLLHPGKTFVEYPGGKFPFDDLQFDWVFSNAVIEHVGDHDAQLFFLNEMLRVARRVFFTTPNKYFPLELHTNAVLLHWNDRLFHWWCRKTEKYFCKENLYLFSGRRLRKLVDLSDACTYTLYKDRFLGLAMTFTVICTSER
ncbi:MAG TPA: methyltransferase domain-containing protein [Pseudolabrys sp.]|nr:methyltransferase domain-containing protein [Pseudolabrys sp.]